MFKDKLNFKKLPRVLNKVRFYLYTGDKYKWNSILFPPKYNTKEEYFNNGYEMNDSDICFASLNRQIDAGKSYNRIVFIFEKSKSITDVEMRRWFLLCKKNGFLPRYASVTSIMKHKSLVLDISKHSRNLLYTYLTVCRFPQEDPCMVRNTLALYKIFGMDFFVAITFATQIRMNNMGHHFLPGDSPYMKPDTVDDLNKTRLEHMIGLYRFIKNDGPQYGSLTRFNAAESISNMCSIKQVLKTTDLLNPNLPSIVRTTTDAKAKKLIKIAKFGD